MEAIELAAPAMAGSASGVVRPRRPIPHDFAEVAKGKSREQIREHYRTSGLVISEWCQAAGVPQLKSHPLPRAMPADFAEHASKLNAELIDRYNCSNEMVARWRRECGIQATGGRSSARPVPDDFRTRARIRTNRALAGDYGVSLSVIARWRLETGVKGGNAPQSFPMPTTIGNRDVTLAGRAADHLRLPRAGGWVVFRCTDTGFAESHGDHFRVGTRVMTEDEMVAMAVRKGFVPYADMSPATKSTRAAVAQ